tara:strand:- start:5448 stop:6479 length:1032 start_codon:yes stop_codon:yes gene_type:complete
MKSIPPEALSYINKQAKSSLSYKNNIGDKSVNLIFILDQTDPMSHIEIYNVYFERVMTWLKMAYTYSNNTCGKDLKIYIYFTPLKKTLPENNTQMIEQIHANTGFTYSCPTGESEIVLFRSQEWFKVFIHESFHLLTLDFSGMNAEKICKKRIKSLFPIESDFLMFESYTEFWTILLNTIFVNFYALRGHKSLREFNETYPFVIKYELTFKMFQLAKILDFMGLEYTDLYKKTKTAKIARDNLYREKTNVFAYSVIGCLLLTNFQDFLEWCDTNNLSLVSFKKTIPNVTSFCDFIESKYQGMGEKNSMYSKFVTKKCFEKVLGSVGKESWILDTLRMSLFELH